MTKNAFSTVRFRALWNSLCLSLPSWKMGALPAALTASLLLLPFSVLQAEAAQTRQARAGSTAQKVKASPASATTIRRAAAQRRDARAVRPSARRQSTQRIRAAQREQQGSLPRSRERTGERGRNTVEVALQRAERSTGLSAYVLRQIAKRESRLDPLARSPSSSARGLMQFTRDTWLEVIRDFGPQHGLARQAAALVTDRDGNIGARNWRELQAILMLRDNPHLSAILAAERLKKAQPALEEAIGRPAEPADLYLVHLLGPTGARRFLTAVRETPDKSSLVVVGQAAKPNPGVFERRGQVLPVKKIYEEVAEMFEAGLRQPESLPRDSTLPVLIADVDQ